MSTLIGPQTKHKMVVLDHKLIIYNMHQSLFMINRGYCTEKRLWKNVTAASINRFSSFPANLGLVTIEMVETFECMLCYNIIVSVIRVNKHIIHFSAIN